MEGAALVIGLVASVFGIIQFGAWVHGLLQKRSNRHVVTERAQPSTEHVLPRWIPGDASSKKKARQTHIGTDIGLTVEEVRGIKREILGAYLNAFSAA